MIKRREFLTFVGTGVLAGCVPKHVAKVYEMFQNKPYYIEEKLRSGPLSINKSRTLRRYKGLPGDPYTRELELIVLARKEKSEESFLYTMPENVWYEIGIQFENDLKDPQRHNEDEAKYSSRILSAVDLLFTGKYKPIAVPSKIVNYHFHPVFLRAYNVYKLGTKRMKKLTKFSSLEEWAYHACTIPSPPSIGDYITDEVFKHKFKKIKSVSRVADHSHIWEFELNRDFMSWLKSNKLSFTEYQQKWKLFEKAFIDVDKRMFLGNGANTAQEYKHDLKTTLRKLKLPYDCVQVKYRQVLPIFSPSKINFQRMLKSYRI